MLGFSCEYSADNVMRASLYTMCFNGILAWYHFVEAMLGTMQNWDQYGLKKNVSHFIIVEK